MSANNRSILSIIVMFFSLVSAIDIMAIDSKVSKDSSDLHDSYDSRNSREVILTPSSILTIILEKNFDIKISDYSTKEKEGDLQKSFAEFDTNLKYNYVLDRNEVPSSSSLDGAGNTSSVITENSNHTLRVTKTFESGIKLDVPYTYKSVYSNSTYRIIKTSYEPSLGIVLTLPVIKYFNSGYSLRNVKNKELELAITLKKHFEKIIEVFNATMELYYDAYEAIKSLEITKLALKDSRENYQYAVEKNKIGRISKIDFLDAESALKNSENDLLKKENELLNKKEKLSLNVFGEVRNIGNLNIDANINISDQLIPKNEYEYESENEINMINAALADRLEVAKSKDAKEQARIKYDASKVDLYPSLDLQPEITLRGMNANGGSANKDIVNRKYNSWKVGLSAERKWNQYAANGANKLDKLKWQQEEIKEEQIKKDVVLEMKQAIRDLLTTEKRLDALNLAAKAQEEKYVALNAKFKLGVVSMFDLNEAYKQKMQGSLDLLKAQIEYKKNVISLYKAKGKLVDELLESNNQMFD